MKFVIAMLESFDYDAYKVRHSCDNILYGEHVLQICNRINQSCNVMHVM